MKLNFFETIALVFVLILFLVVWQTPARADVADRYVVPAEIAYKGNAILHLESCGTIVSIVMIKDTTVFVLPAHEMNNPKYQGMVDLYRTISHEGAAVADIPFKELFGGAIDLTCDNRAK